MISRTRNTAPLPESVTPYKAIARQYVVFESDWSECAPPYDNLECHFAAGDNNEITNRDNRSHSVCLEQSVVIFFAMLFF
jgi:hypothetical protein